MSTIDSICRDVASTVRGITPSHPHMSDVHWVEVKAISEVPSCDPRSFLVDLVDIAESTDGIYGCEVEHTATLKIYASYGALDYRDAKAMRSRDEHQLWVLMNRLCDSLIRVDRAGWEPENSDDGYQWGSHTFDVRFLLPLSE